MNDITNILNAIGDGDRDAVGQLMPLVYSELYRLANSRMARENPGQTLTATALVHETFLRVFKQDRTPRWQARGHFFATAAEAMRRILIDIARRKKRVRHGGNRKKVNLESGVIIDHSSDSTWAIELLELDSALAELEKEYPNKAQLVKLRYFGGLTMEDAARSMAISERTAHRYWKFSRAWLYEKIGF